jgi:hypothetical protein
MPRNPSKTIEELKFEAKIKIVEAQEEYETQLYLETMPNIDPMYQYCYTTKAYSQPTMITSIEGIYSDKRIHAHLAIGNLQKNIDIRNTIERAWWACDFAHKSIVIKPLSNTYGWLDYITKEANVGNVDALRIQSIKQPQIYLSDISVENSL